jgi:acetyltransferase-like isoleucine patch superfamily enzyme
MLFNFIIPKILEKINFPVYKFSKISTNTRIGSYSSIYYSTINNYCRIGKNNKINKSILGKFVSIGDNCIIGAPNHPIYKFSTSSIFYKYYKNFEMKVINNDEVYKQTIVGNDVWIGSNVLIKSGVKIGNGVVIGMGSIVTKDIPDYSVVVGVPARVIKKRFDDETIKKLMKLEWWNLRINQIIDNGYLLSIGNNNENITFNSEF